MDTEWLARLQFALTITLHYLFPPLTLGLGIGMLAIQALYIKSLHPYYHQMSRFLVKLYALIFGFGSVTGFMMKAEIGSRWAVYTHYIHQIFSDNATTEAVGSFLLESSLIALLLWGWGRLKQPVYALITLVAVLIPHFNAAWIVNVNSWQQTPQGFQIIGQGLQAYAQITNHQAMIFNPSAIQRILHVYTAGWVTGGALLASIGAYYAVRGKQIPLARKSLVVGLLLTVLASLLQLATGHLSAVSVLEHQPAKLAAMEGHFHTKDSADLYLAGWVDPVTRKTWGVKLPGGLSFLAYGNFNHPVTGLDQIPKANQPPLNMVFQAYHLMLALGVAIFALSVWGLYILLNGNLWEKTMHPTTEGLETPIPDSDQPIRAYRNPFLCGMQGFVLLPLLANQAGWYTAELGRQPWIVYGMLRTTHGLSVSLKTQEVVGSILLYGLAYISLGLLFTLMVRHQLRLGPSIRENLTMPLPSRWKTLSLARITPLLRAKRPKMRLGRYTWLWFSRASRRFPESIRARPAQSSVDRAP